MVPWRQAQVHVLTHGLHYASAVFEGERSYDGRVFALAEHSQRLVHSAHRLDMRLPYTADEIAEATQLVIRHNRIRDGYIRPVAWRGSEGMALGEPHNSVHVAIAAWSRSSGYDGPGLRTTVARWQRPPPHTIPWDAKAAGCYMISTLAKHEAAARGYDDAIMLDSTGAITEATGANLFFVSSRRREIHTATPDCFLDGITRQRVIGLARDHGITVVERRILPTELTDFDGCFMTGTASEVKPILSIDHASYQQGEITDLLRDKYLELVRS